VQVRSILTTTDLSQPAVEGLRVAAEWADKFGARLTVCHVLPTFLPIAPPISAVSRSPFVVDRALLDKAAEAVRRQVEISTARERNRFSVAVVEGTPDRGILEQAERDRTDLIVISSQGHSAVGEWLLGSVSEQVVRGAACPVLVARPRSTTAAGCVLGGIDGSESAFRVADAAATVARALNRELLLVHVLYVEEPIANSLGLIAGGPVPQVSPEYRQWLHMAAKERLQEMLARSGVPARVQIEEGHPGATLRRVAREQSADVVVIGRTGATGLERLLLGRVATQVVRGCPSSVLTVH
jgi:nucleotide-binding universal stress UspA family protein